MVPSDLQGVTTEPTQDRRRREGVRCTSEEERMKERVKRRRRRRKQDATERRGRREMRRAEWMRSRMEWKIYKNKGKTQKSAKRSTSKQDLTQKQRKGGRESDNSRV